MEYMYETQKSTLEHITSSPLPHRPVYGDRHLYQKESGACGNHAGKTEEGHSLWVLDRTKTAMGARLLRSYIEQPLIHKDDHPAAGCGGRAEYELYFQEELGEYLNPIYDLERLIGRISYKTASPRDLIAFKTSLEMLPHIKRLLGEFQTGLLKELESELDPLEDIWNLIHCSIVDDPPITVRDGGIIKEGFHEEADRLRNAKTEERPG